MRMQAESNRQFSSEMTNQARARLVASGESVKSWSARHGYPWPLVFKVLSGKRRCVRGLSVEIAQKLGLLPDPATAAAEFAVSAGQTVGGGAPVVACDRSALSRAERAE